MANLVQRLTGDLTPADIQDPQNNKIAIHAFLGALNEYRRGKLTQSQVINAFDLTAAQTTQADILRSLFVAAPDKTEFARVFKDLMYMGEVGLVIGNPSPFVSQYRDIVQVNQRLEDEVVDQGGAVPSPLI